MNIRNKLKLHLGGRVLRPVMGINPVRRLQKGNGACTSRPSNKIVPQHTINRENSRIREDLADRQLLQEMQARKMKALLEELEDIPIGQSGEMQKEILQEIADLRQKGRGACGSKVNVETFDGIDAVETHVRKDEPEECIRGELPSAPSNVIQGIDSMATRRRFNRRRQPNNNRTRQPKLPNRINHRKINF